MRFSRSKNLVITSASVFSLVNTILRLSMILIKISKLQKTRGLSIRYFQKELSEVIHKIGMTVETLKLRLNFLKNQLGPQEPEVVSKK